MISNRKYVYAIEYDEKDGLNDQGRSDYTTKTKLLNDETEFNLTYQKLKENYTVISNIKVYCGEIFRADFK